jgi:microcystin-dependent protein
MTITRVKVWNPGDVLTANDLNSEFNNITTNIIAEPFIATQPIDLNGQLLVLDANGDTLLDGSADNVVDFTIGGQDDFRWSMNEFRALAGSNIVLDDGDVTLTNGNVAITSGQLLTAKGATIASSSAMSLPTDANMFDISGVADINSLTISQAGAMFYARCTGAGLNINHNATSMISPWGRDYRTVPNEVMCFLSLGGGNYQFWSLNGPKERVGVTIEGNVAAAPAGYLDEETTVDRATYSGLFAEIGTTFGVGDGSTTFDLPATKGRTIINVDGSLTRITAASTNGANADTLGGVGGAETHTLSIVQIPAHGHPGTLAASGSIVAGTPVQGSLMELEDNTPVSDTSNRVPTQGGGGAHSNTQPWMAKKKFIRF